MSQFSLFFRTRNSHAALLFRSARLGLIAGSLVSVLLSPLHSAELIPSSRLVDWTAGVAVGVPGGIPTDRTKLINVTAAPYNADSSGATNAAPAINAAIAAAKSGDVVYLPAGTYQITASIGLGPDQDNITIRGAGMDRTIIDARVNTPFYVGSSSDYRWDWPGSENNVTGGLTKGSKTINLPNTNAFSPGQIIRIMIDNQVDSTAIAAGATPTISTSGWPTLRSQLTRVTGKTPTSLSIYPSINFTPDAGLGAKIAVAQFQTDRAGIEDLTIDGANGPMVFPILFTQCFASWVKNVKIVKTSNYGIYFTNSLNCEVRQCVINERKSGGSNGAGILTGTVSASLFEDNIILDIFPAVEVNFSSMGNVFAYNVMENPIGGTLNTNHGPHNSFNLYEGNVTPNMQSDGYFGSASDDTFFRNWIHGTNASKTLRTFTVSLNRFTRNYSFVGNIIGEAGTNGKHPYSFGNPNMGNSSFTGNAQPSKGQFWRDWNATATLTTRTSDTGGMITLNSGSAYVGQLISLRWGNDTNRHEISAVANVSENKVSWVNGTGTNLPPQGAIVQVLFGPGGYQEADLDVERTTVLKANYFFGFNSIPDGESIGSEVLPPSLFRSAKPDWFGNMQWPPFDPTNPSAATFTSIPAGYRYLNGITTTPVAPVASSAPSNVRVKIQQ